MVRSTSLAAAAALLLTAASFLRAPGAGRVRAQPAGFDPERLRRVENVVHEHVTRGELPGAVLLLARGGTVAAHRAFGYADLEARRAMRGDDIFRLASAAKIVMAVALLTLYEEGRLTLRDSVADHVPELAKPIVRGAGGSLRPATRRLTVRDLLRHTCGWGYGMRDPQQSAYRRVGLMTAGPELDWTHGLTLSDWVARLATVPLDDEPGTRFQYGFGSDIAGLVVERVAGKPLDEVLRERVFRPLRMEDTAFVVPDGKLGRLAGIYAMEGGRPRALDPPASSPLRHRPLALSGGGGWDNLGNGGLVSTAPDLFRLLQMLLEGGTLEGARILSRASVDVLFRNHLAELTPPDSLWPGVGFGFGYAVVYDPARYGEAVSPETIWWAGSTNVHYWVDRRQQVVGVYLSQVQPFPYLDVMNRLRHLTAAAVP